MRWQPQFSKGNSRRGVTFVETMVASAILFGVGLLAFSSFLSGVNTQLITSTRKVGVDTDAIIVRSSMDKAIFNSVTLKPAEDLLVAGDQKFSGLLGLVKADYGTNGNYSIPAVGDCKNDIETIQGYNSSTTGEKFSILMVATTEPSIIAEKTLNPFDESTLATPTSAPALRITVHDGAISTESGYGTTWIGGYGQNSSYGARYIFGRSAQRFKNVVIRDSDALYVKRYEVSSDVVPNPTYYVGTSNPYDYTSNFWTSYHYWRLKLKMVQSPAGFRQRTIASGPTLITDSMVFPVMTKLICVNNAGKLVQKDLDKGTQDVLLNPDSSNFTIERFNLTYANIRPGKFMSSAYFTEFGNLDSRWQVCTNVVKVALKLQSKDPKHTIENVSWTMLLESHQSDRSSTCDTYIPPACPAGAC